MARRNAAPADIERVISLPALKFAWLRVRENKGAAGGDGISLKRFERMLEANLLELADQVRAKTYEPSTVRTVTIHGPRKSRRIAILSVRDRVLQRSVLELLDPHCDRQFRRCSYGYRRGKSLHDAVETILKLRDNGMTTVIDADIQRCFESLDHAILLDRIRNMLPGLHPTIMQLFTMWISMRPRHFGPATKGVLQGAPISPLLCNIYLHQMDVNLTSRGYALVRYADDFVILCGNAEQAVRCLADVETTLDDIRLLLNRGKTSITTFDEGLDFLGVHFTEDSFSYSIAGKRIVLRDIPPKWFHYHPVGYDYEE